MNEKKMAQFICDLRKEKKITQEELASRFYISREAVSKWERGVTCPDPAILLKLSEFFNVSVNELLYGERKNDINNAKINAITLNLYNNCNKNKIVIVGLVTGFIFLIFIFLIYYFFMNYNSINAYKIDYNDNNLQIKNGTIISTNEKIYFNIGTLNSIKSIKDMELYYTDDENNLKTIMKTNNTNIAFYDLLGYNEYFDFNKKDKIINNLNIKITYEDESILNIRLKPRKFMTNKNFFPKRYDSN